MRLRGAKKLKSQKDEQDKGSLQLNEDAVLTKRWAFVHRMSLVQIKKQCGVLFRCVCVI